MTEEQKTEGCSESACSSCSQAGSCSSKKVDLHEPANAHSSIGKVIGVVSGKGGVGKSLVTGSLARQMVKMGYKVGILDADITGPSIPKMYGIHEKAQGTQEGILPRIAKDGTKIMSVNLLLEDEEAPVIWRGPVIAGVVKQFWTEVMWGDRIPVTSGRWDRDRDISAGSGQNDREKGVWYGKADEYSGAWHC